MRSPSVSRAFLFLAGSLLLWASCSTAPRPSAAAGPAALSGKKEQGQGAEVSPVSAGNGTGTPLTVPTREELKKNDADAGIVTLLERATPTAIREAVDLVRRDPKGMTDRNRIFLAVAGELMKILYPLESADWQMPSIPDNDPWTQAIRSSRLGVYDYNTGNADFLSRVLPSLVLFISPTSTDFYPEAKKALASAAAANPSSVMPPLFLGIIAERSEGLAASASWYRKAWETDNGCYPAGEGLVRALIASGDGKNAFPVAKSLYDRYPEVPEMLKLCAESAFSAENWDTADPYILQVLKAEPANTEYLLMRARILVERKDYLKANSLLDAYATVDKTGRSYLILKARVLREWNKNLVSAIGILEDADRRYPDDRDIMLASAELSYQTGKTVNGAGGRDFVRRVLATEPNNPKALALLANDYIGKQAWTDALGTTAALIALDQGADSLSLRLRALIGAARFDEALTLSKRLYDQSPDSESAVSWRLEALIGSGDRNAASALIATRLGDAPAALKSRLYFYKSALETDPDAQLAALRSSLLADPRNVDSLYATYRWYYGRKDWRKAQYYLKQVIAISPGNEQYAKLLAQLDDLLAQ